MNNLQILSKEIRQLDGMHCLNDLHKASGGEKKHRPQYFLANQQTKELIAEIKEAGIPATQVKRGVGTYVCKEMVYSYAMWVSAKFQLTVIRAFDKLVNQSTPKIDHKPETLTPAQQRHIQNRTSELVRKQVGSTYAGIYRGIKDKFNVGTYKDIPESQYHALCNYLGCRPLEGEVIPNEYPDFASLSKGIDNDLRTKRLFVVMENDTIISVTSLREKNIVNADGYRKLSKNMRMLQDQMRWLDGDADSSILDQEPTQITNGDFVPKDSANFSFSGHDRFARVLLSSVDGKTKITTISQKAFLLTKDQLISSFHDVLPEYLLVKKSDINNKQKLLA